VMKAPLERDFQKQALQYLQMIGCHVWRQNQGAVQAEYKGKARFFRFASVSGISDIIGHTPAGKFLAVECKRKGGKPTLNQKGFLSLVKAGNGIAICADSLDSLMKQYQEQADG